MSLFHKASKQKPKFYCDNCGTEVEQSASECPKCGRSFTSVRCPVCNFVGEVSVFDNGCPSCGYSAPKTAKTSAQPRPMEPVLNSSRYTDALPLWVYLVSGVAFAGALVFLLRMIAQ
ncbi:MAG: zinc-ribbon domain-containing protein [Treponema sp.]|nr:zinc-ribbon domain-containing protein [Treponema sp.]